MAVDTRDKRVSIIGISLPFRTAISLPDGNIGVADRQVIPYYYSGIAFGGYVPPANLALWYPRIRRRRR